jgi:hypothetical protein
MSPFTFNWNWQPPKGHFLDSEINESKCHLKKKNHPSPQCHTLIVFSIIQREKPWRENATNFFLSNLMLLKCHLSLFFLWKLIYYHCQDFKYAPGWTWTWTQARGDSAPGSSSECSMNSIPPQSKKSLIKLLHLSSCLRP